MTTGLSLLWRGLATSILLVVLFAQPAAADTTIDVTTPMDGFYQPGKPVMLLVAVTADQAITGTIEVSVEGEVDLIPARTIEVPGGSTKTFAVPVELPPWIGGVGVVVRTSEGETRRARPNLQVAGGEEPFAVMPSLAVPGIPDRVDLLAENRQARIILVEPSDLDYGVTALNGASAVLASESDLADLSDPALATLKTWVATGGRLLIDGTVDDIPSALSDVDFADTSGDGAIQARAWSGSGSIYLTGDNLANGRFDGLVAPRFADANGEFGMEGDMMMFEASGVIEDLASDAGFRARPIMGYLAVLLAYIALVGPIMWLLLSRRQREPVMWMLVPALALLFSVGVWGAGRFFRQGSTGSHVTVVGDVAGSSFVDTTYLLSSAGGGTTGIELADGWEAASPSADPWDWRLQQANLPPLEVTGRRLSADVPPAGLVLAAASSTATVADASGWTVDGSLADGRFQGSAINNTGSQLTNVVMVVNGRSQNLDDVGAGQTVSFDVRADQSGVAVFENEVMNRMAGPGGRGETDSPSAVLRWVTRHASADSNFIVGWSTDPSGPLEPIGGDGLTRGRTGFISILPSDLAGTEVLGNPPAGTPVPTRVAVTDFRWSGEPGATIIGAARGNLFEGQILTTSIELPPGLSPEATLSLRVSSETAALDIWNGAEWIDSGIGEQAPRTEVDVPLPAAAIEGGIIRVRMLSDYPFTAPAVIVNGGGG